MATAEKHQKTTVNSVADVMAAIFNMVITSGQDAVQWADTANAADGSRALFNGTGFTTAAAVTTAGPSTYFTNTSSYLIIESKATMPGPLNLRWQAKISRTAGNNSLYVNFAPRGGMVSGAFPGTVISTGALDCFGGIWGAGSRVLVSTSDLDTYGSGTNYAYLRIIMWESSAVTKGFYVGGYIPFDQTNNLYPAVCLLRVPNLGAGSGTWSYPSTGASNYNRISPEYAGTTLNLAAAGYAHIKAMDTITYVNRDPNANWVNFPVYIRCVDDSSFFGYFGKYTMFAGDTFRTLATADGAGQYLAINDLVMRWNPTA